MTTYRDNLPQLGERPFITDGGLETVMVFQKDIELPEFAAYDLLRTPQGGRLLRSYYEEYLHIAQRYGRGIILETPTWRANTDWGAKLGDSPDTLAALNQAAVDLLAGLKRTYDSAETPVVLSGNIGPQGDGYAPGATLSEAEAEAYHRPQLSVFALSQVDMVCALTLNYVEEAIGLARAARALGLPICIAFTVETDGRLPTGDSLSSAIDAVDAASEGWPAYYMINCAHACHFQSVLENGGEWTARIRGIRANASKMSHEELDNSESLDDGDPEEFGRELNDLHGLLPNLTVLGGCCGTDGRHIESICRHAV